jgi:hypothetical protein
MKKKTLTPKQKKIILIAMVLLAAVIAILIFTLKKGGSILTAAPSVTIETPEKRSASNKESFSLEVQLSGLGEAVYPAASFSIQFDPAKLEFLGIEEGDVLITDTESSSGWKAPQWSVNVERSNEIGQVNLMYLDLTGGKNAFTKASVAEGGGVLLRLQFRLRGSVRSGEIYELSFADAVFAASDETESLAMANGTLCTNNGRIVIGD